jgi:hypothetical protein
VSNPYIETSDQLIQQIVSIKSIDFNCYSERLGFACAGSEPNTNGLLRQYFPRARDLSRFSQAQLNRIALRLKQRPKKTLGFETPADRLRAVLH